MPAYTQEHTDPSLLSPHISRYKLCDFGSCSTLSAVLESRNDIAVEEERIQRTYGGSTMAYRAPELVDLYSRKRVCEQVDVWALGCLLFKLIFQVRLFLRESSASSCELVRARVSIQGPVEVCGSVGTFGKSVIQVRVCRASCMRDVQVFLFSPDHKTRCESTPRLHLLMLAFVIPFVLLRSHHSRTRRRGPWSGWES